MSLAAPAPTGDRRPTPTSSTSTTPSASPPRCSCRRGPRAAADAGRGRAEPPRGGAAPEGTRIADQLQKIEGVDWSAAPPNAALARLTAAGGRGEWRRRGGRTRHLRHRHGPQCPGPGPAHRVRGLLYSTHPMLQHREVFLGRVNPGQTRTAQVKGSSCQRPHGPGRRPEPARLSEWGARTRADLHGAPNPRAAQARVRLHLADHRRREGQRGWPIQPGEELRLMRR